MKMCTIHAFMISIFCINKLKYIVFTKRAELHVQRVHFYVFYKRLLQFQ